MHSTCYTLLRLGPSRVARAGPGRRPHAPRERGRISGAPRGAGGAALIRKEGMNTLEVGGR